MCLALWLASVPLAASQSFYFNRIATFFLCEQIDENCNTSNVTFAEIIDVSPDGQTICYIDGGPKAVGFVDVSDPRNPMAMGYVDVGGEPTSVAFTKDGKYVVAAVDTSPNYTDPSGELDVIDVETRQVVATIQLGGQPDSVKVSPDDAFIAVAIENERDEELGDGGLPQMPPGYLSVIDKTNEDPTQWTHTIVEMTGLDGVFYPEDPEPEFVDINEDNIAVITLQENNAIVMVNLETLEIVKSFSCGNTSLTDIDTVRDRVILQNATLDDVPREPDALAWLSGGHFATADEGDWLGGSRGFTIFDNDGNIVYDAKSELEHEVARLGFYPETRSNAKGNEPEGMIRGIFGGKDLLFILSERSGVTFVYDVSDVTSPKHVQTLPTGPRPEDAAVFPDRNLLFIASELDNRGSAQRASIMIYEYQEVAQPDYPHYHSIQREGHNAPIPFGGLSGLACADYPGLSNPVANTLYTIEDSFYIKSRIFRINTSTSPYRIDMEIRIYDTNGALAAVVPTMVNDDGTVNLDQEGIAVSQDGTFWIAHEGAGTVGDESRPVTSPNLLVHITPEGDIAEVVQLPEDLNAIQLRFGFEGLAEHGDSLVVSFQHAWGDEENPRIGIYNKETKEWKFAFYPLDKPKSQNGGWVGVSDLAPIGEGRFLVLERDNQGTLLFSNRGGRARYNCLLSTFKCLLSPLPTISMTSHERWT